MVARPPSARASVSNLSVEPSSRTGTVRSADRFKVLYARVDQEVMLKHSERPLVGSVHDNHAHFEHQIEACDAALRRLASLEPAPLNAIEALLLARELAEQGLAKSRQQRLSA